MEITLTELLDAREERARIQTQILREHSCPLVCFTMNIAGPVKTSPSVIRAFRYGLDALDRALKEYSVLQRTVKYPQSGPEAFFSVECDPQTLKNICVEIEEACKMGRLFDMDVIDTDGKKLERQNERCCIICGKAGRVCAAGRLHSVEELQEKTQSIIREHFAEEDSKKISELAKECLIEEVRTTPKPGLVDLSNNGSHRDMNVQTFEASANSLVDYFKKCMIIGINTAENPPEDTFYMLRSAGIEAEKAMYHATDGVNTHKGIIYSMGVILGALGRLWKPDTPIANTDSILEECSDMTRTAVEKDFANIDGTTAGGRLYLNKGIRGIRGEVADGFPSVRNIALPIYKSELANGKKKNDAGVMTLLHLIAHIYDTSIYNRGGEEGVAYAKDYANRLICNSPNPKDVEEMDKAFTEKNLSPGGCADLLAITYFLSAIEGK